VRAKVCEQEREQTREAAACRLTSLNPSASFLVRGGGSSKDDGTRYRPLRSASMRETSYSRSIRKRFTLLVLSYLNGILAPISESGTELWPPFKNLERKIGPHFKIWNGTMAHFKIWNGSLPSKSGTDFDHSIIWDGTFLHFMIWNGLCQRILAIPTRN
jgi:hypothetical protein